MLIMVLFVGYLSQMSVMRRRNMTKQMRQANASTAPFRDSRILMDRVQGDQMSL
jgi:hypothetical protein